VEFQHESERKLDEGPPVSQWPGGSVEDARGVPRRVVLVLGVGRMAMLDLTVDWAENNSWRR